MIYIVVITAYNIAVYEDVFFVHCVQMLFNFYEIVNSQFDKAS